MILARDRERGREGGKETYTEREREIDRIYVFKKERLDKVYSQTYRGLVCGRKMLERINS